MGLDNLGMGLEGLGMGAENLGTGVFNSGIVADNLRTCTEVSGTGRMVLGIGEKD